MIIRALLSFLAATVSLVGTGPFLPKCSAAPAVLEAAPMGIPTFAFARALPAKAPPALLEWTTDGAALISLEVLYLEGWFRTQTSGGQVLTEYALPSAPTYHEIVSNREVIMPGDMRIGAAFAVADVVTGRTVFQENDPAPHSPGTASATIRFALPADKSIVVVGYGYPRGGQPVFVYDTRDWRKVRTLMVPADGPVGVGRMRVSNDGRWLAYANVHGLVVVDLTSGEVAARVLLGVLGDFAFSTDGAMLAAAEVRPSDTGDWDVPLGLIVIRVSDGAEVASLRPATPIFINSIRWDAQRRFLAFIGDNSNVHVWNPAAPSGPELVIPLKSVSRSLALSPDGKRLAVGDGDAIDLFEIGL